MNGTRVIDPQSWHGTSELDAGSFPCRASLLVIRQFGHRLGVFLSILREKNSCSPALKTNCCWQFWQERVLSSNICLSAKRTAPERTCSGLQISVEWIPWTPNHLCPVDNKSHGRAFFYLSEFSTQTSWIGYATQLGAVQSRKLNMRLSRS